MCTEAKVVVCKWLVLVDHDLGLLRLLEGRRQGYGTISLDTQKGSEDVFKSVATRHESWILGPPQKRSRFTQLSFSMRNEKNIANFSSDVARRRVEC